MRFGKKLALQVMEDTSGAPYLSHKPMKEAINRTVRELRLYQQKLQSPEQAWRNGGAGFAQQVGGGSAGTAASPELAQLEERVAALDKQLFLLVDEDLKRILDYTRLGEAQLTHQLFKLQSQALEAGILFEESQLQRLERALPNLPEDRTVLCRQLLELRLRSEPSSMCRHLEELAKSYNQLVDTANQHSQYLEINVAGFRKLLKRHEKQIPQKFRSRPMPCLGFHRLVTHTSRQLLELTREVGNVLTDARQRLVAAAAAAPAGSEGLEAAARIGSQQPELNELRGLGPECVMVLDIQKQLKDPMNSQIMQLASSVNGPHPGYLYPKPGAPVRSVGQEQQEDQMTSMSNNGMYAMPDQSAGYPSGMAGAGQGPMKRQYVGWCLQAGGAPEQGGGLLGPGGSDVALRGVC